MATRQLSVAQQVALQVAHHWGDSRDYHRVVLAQRHTLEALVRRGLAEDLRRDGGYWVATLTNEGADVSRQLADEERVTRTAEQIMRDASPEGLLAKRWRDSIGGEARAHITDDGKVTLQVTLRFVSEAVCDKFRLDVMNVLLDYKRRSQEG